MAIGKTVELDPLLELILNKIAGVLEADRATLYLVEEDGKLVSRIAMGAEKSTIEIPVGRGIAGHVARTGRPLRVKDAHRDARFDPSWDKLTGYRTRSTLAVPVKNHQGKTIGVVQVLNKLSPGRRPRTFTQHDVELLSALAMQAAVALDKSRLFQSLMRNNIQLVETTGRLEHSLRDLEFLYQLELGMGQAEDLEQLARSVITLTAQTCQAGAGALAVAARNGQLPLYVVNLQKAGEVREVIVRPGEGIAARAMDAGATIAAETVREVGDPLRVRKLLGIQVRSAIAAPLVVEGEGTHGALVLYNHKRRPSAPDTDEAALLKLVSANVSTQLRLLRMREQQAREDRLRSIGQLLSGVMHDLRSPLTVINGYVQLMELSDEPVIRAEYAATIREQFEIIGAMQHDLLAYARGQIPILVRQVHLRQLADDLRRDLESDLAASGIRLVLEVERRATAFFDQGKIRRAVNNLARNAVEAMPQGGELTIRCRRDEEQLVVSVSDTGPGIPKGIRKRLFEPFVTAGKAMGSGLGLSIVKQIVDDHGGRIEVESTRRGTTFTLRLPQATAPRSHRPRSMHPPK